MKCFCSSCLLLFSRVVAFVFLVLLMSRDFFLVCLFSRDVVSGVDGFS